MQLMIYCQQKVFSDLINNPVCFFLGKVKSFRLDKEMSDLVKNVSEQLDLNRDGRISKEEFLESFVSNGEFMDLVQCIKGEDVWGDLLLGLPDHPE